MHLLASLPCIKSCADQASFKAVPRTFLFLPPYARELSELVLLHITKDAIISTRHTHNIFLAIYEKIAMLTHFLLTGGMNNGIIIDITAKYYFWPLQLQLYFNHYIIQKNNIYQGSFMCLFTSVSLACLWNASNSWL